MDKYFNSIVACQRGRRWSLRAFLRAFFVLSDYIDPDSFEIVITDMDNDNEGLIGKYSDSLNITHCQVEYDGPFCRGRALNHSVKHAKGKYITSIDIDSIATKFFMQHIIDFFSSHDERAKLCHRVRLIDQDHAIRFMFSLFSQDDIDKMIEHHSSFAIYRERYTIDELVRDNGVGIEEEWYNGDALGNSQFTMLRSSFMELGGYDERFDGYGCEDLDFNMRAYKYLGGGFLSPPPEHSIYHIVYSSASQIVDNIKQYKDNKSDNVICLPISPEWGQF